MIIMIEQEEETKVRRGNKGKADYTLKHLLSYVFWRLKDRGFTYKDINRIVKVYHDMAFEDVSMGRPFSLPHGLGDIKTSKFERELYFDDNGDLINNLPINKRATYNLWAENPEFINKKYIRYMNEHSNGYLFSLRFKIKSQNSNLYRNYTFRKNRILTETFSDNIINKKVDATLGKIY